MHRNDVEAIFLVALACLLGWPWAAGAQESGPVVVLDSFSFWRVHYSLRKPVIGGQPAALGFDTVFPAAEWAKPGFDDGTWRYIPGPPFPPMSNWALTVKENAGWISTSNGSPGLALLCLRGKFSVSDPAAARDLTVSVTYRGGVVLYMNGQELARGNLAKGDLGQLAEDYPDEAFFKADGSALVADEGEKNEENLRRWRLHTRRLENVPVPASALRKGANVLGIEVHRAGYPRKLLDLVAKRASHERTARLWSTCGLVNVRLNAPTSAGLTPNAVRPKGFQVWNSEAVAPDFTLDWGDPNETLRPIRLVGARNGVFSGKVVVGSTEPIRGLKAVAQVFNLRYAKDGAVIPAAALLVRYAVVSETEQCASQRYPLDPAFFHALDENPPAEVPVRPGEKGIQLRPWVLPGQPPPVFGAVQPVWLTVKIPAAAKPGEYDGTLTLAADEQKPLAVPVRLKVHDYQLPVPAGFSTFVDFMQSPESVALQYQVAPFSDEHFKLLEKCFQILGEIGNATVYLHLIAQTNQGNEQTMVRWVKKGEGRYEHDFTPLERYLDTAIRNMGQPRLVCLYVWDIFLDSLSWDGKEKKEGGDVPVTGLDPATGKTETLLVPRYVDPKNRELWRPLFEGVKKRLAERGLEQQIYLGLVPDSSPSPEVTKALAGWFPGAKWMRHAHSERRNLNGEPIGYQCLVWTPHFPDTPDLKPMKGWQSPDLVTQCIRNWGHMPLNVFRLMAEMNIGGQQRGVGRVGLDFWPVLLDSKGKRTGNILARYPHSSWANMNWVPRFCANAGPQGPRITQRLLLLREGLQECEARILIERALAEKKLDGDLAARAEKLILSRTAMVRIALDNHAVDGFGKDAGHDWWSTPGEVGYQWFIGSDWQAESDRLYALAAEVARKIGGR